jgi:hypothetical protein
MRGGRPDGHHGAFDAEGLGAILGIRHSGALADAGGVDQLEGAPIWQYNVHVDGVPRRPAERAHDRPLLPHLAPACIA